ncbi:MAG: FGGY family carbohydrate kinase [Anaerolineae bacterium]|nr:FGGY family carbohydrate kinase [Anaerolineae bacterium]
MSQTCLIGVDLGTSVVKTSLFDSEGHVLADATRATRLSQPMPGRAEQQGDDFYAAALATLQEGSRKSRSHSGIGGCHHFRRPDGRRDRH